MLSGTSPPQPTRSHNDHPKIDAQRPPRRITISAIQPPNRAWQGHRRGTWTPIRSATWGPDAHAVQVHRAATAPRPRGLARRWITPGSRQGGRDRPRHVAPLDCPGQDRPSRGPLERVLSSRPRGRSRVPDPGAAPGPAGRLGARPDAGVGVAAEARSVLRAGAPEPVAITIAHSIVIAGPDNAPWKEPS